jgi:hypothetical protein
MDCEVVDCVDLVMVMEDVSLKRWGLKLLGFSSLRLKALHRKDIQTFSRMVGTSSEQYSQKMLLIFPSSPL